MKQTEQFLIYGATGYTGKLTARTARDKGLKPILALLAAAQAVEHYEISRYGTLRTWAEELGMPDAAKLLQATLDEEKATARPLPSLPNPSSTSKQSRS